MTRTTGVPTVGVEEEFFLVDPRDGRLLPRARSVARSADRCGQPLDLELKTAQVETNTAVCADIAALREQLEQARTHACAAAAEHGAALLPSGVAPAAGRFATVTGTERYSAMQAHYGELAREYEACGCHVHVQVDDRESAVQVSNHLRPWLPVLLALTANSPLFHGRDTGFASWRAMIGCRWACSWAPPFFDSAAHYDATVAAMVEAGVLLDEAMVCWDVRPSSHLPTVEVRVSDVPATVEETVLLATLVRALVMRALRDTAAGAGTAAPSPEILRSAYQQAARDGLTAALLDPVTSTSTSASQRISALIAHVRPELEATGELASVCRAVGRLLAGRGGAARQRRQFGRRHDVADVVSDLTRERSPEDRPVSAGLEA